MALTKITQSGITNGAVTAEKIASGVIGGTPAFYVSLGGDGQTLANATVTKVSYAVEHIDSDGKYDTSNYRFTPTVAGTYFFFMTYRVAANNQNINARILKNGTITNFSIFVGTTSQASTFVHTMLVLDDNDYVEGWVEQNSGGNATMYGDNAGTGSNIFGGYRVY